MADRSGIDEELEKLLGPELASEIGLGKAEPSKTGDAPSSSPAVDGSAAEPPPELATAVPVGQGESIEPPEAASSSSNMSNELLTRNSVSAFLTAPTSEKEPVPGQSRLLPLPALQARSFLQQRT